jgi:hypothetical protein
MFIDKIRATPLHRIGTQRLGLAIAAGFIIWLTLIQPLITTAILCFGAVAIALHILAIGIQEISTILTPWLCRSGRRIPGWQMALAGSMVALVIVPHAEPAQAQFFNSLETRLKEVITAADTGIDENIITQIFVFFRILVVLAFVTGVIICLTLAMRGADWQPLLNVMGIGVAFVVGVEVISQLMLGGAGTGGGAGGGAAGGGGG